MSEKFRLVTRSDMDGLVSAVLLRHLGKVDKIDFVHPKDMQDGKIEIGPGDITTNLPYVEGVHMAFDHHISEMNRVGKRDNHIIEPSAPSAARVVYNYFGGDKTFPPSFSEMMAAADRSDSADFTEQEIFNPEGWVLLSFIMDARTGLGRFKDFKISNYNLMMDLIGYCVTHSIEEILTHPDVAERVDLYFTALPDFKRQLNRCASHHGGVTVIDLRNEETIYPGNRFMVYAVHPGARVSIHVMWGLNKQNTVLSAGKSIFNRSAKISIGDLMLEYGGGGHAAAGACQVENSKADGALNEIIFRINEAG